MDLLTGNQWIGYRNSSIQILPVHIHSSNLAVFVGGVIIYAFICVAAAGIEGEFIFVLPDAGKPPWLCNTVENMEELADTFGFCASAPGI